MSFLLNNTIFESFKNQQHSIVNLTIFNILSSPSKLKTTPYAGILMSQLTITNKPAFVSYNDIR